MSGPSIYVASPLGFSEPGRRYLEQVLHPTLATAGFDVLDPWASGRRLLDTLPAELDEADANRRLGAANQELLDHCDGVLAILDGPDVDSGTAAEIGYAAGMGRVVIGLRSDFRIAGDNASAPINLQVLHFIAAARGAYCTELSGAIGELQRRFDDALEHARVFHLASRSTWLLAKSSGSYRSSTREQSLDEVGFIHCSFADQLLATAARFYADVDPNDFAVLVIDPARLREPLVVEAAGSGARFPHIYGPLNPDAVVATIPLLRAGEEPLLGEPTSA